MCQMGETTASLVVNSKGRTSLPVVVRRQAGIEGETEMVARVDGPGRIVLETRESVRSRVWANAPESGSTGGADVRQMREEDVRTSDAHAVERATTRTTPDAGDRLLAELGL